jgi:hypothetical protein
MDDSCVRLSSMQQSGERTVDFVVVGFLRERKAVFDD